MQRYSRNITRLFYLKYFKEIVLAVAMVLISQTRLRFFKLPLGPGELLISMLLVYYFFSKTFTAIKSSSFLIMFFKFSKPFVHGWRVYYIRIFGLIFFLVALVASAITSSDIKVLNSHYMMHNLFSYFFMGIIFLYLMMEEIDFKMVGYFFAVFLVFLLSLEYFLLPAFYDGVRFSGLSSNPNQLALYLLFVPMFLINSNMNKGLTCFINVVLGLCALFFLYSNKSSAALLGYVFISFILCFIKILKLNSIGEKIKYVPILIITLFSICFLFITCINEIRITFWESKPVIKIFTPKLNEKLISFYSNLHTSTDVNKPQTLITSNRMITNQLSNYQTKADSVNIAPFFSFHQESLVRQFLWSKAIRIISHHSVIGIGAGGSVYLPTTRAFSEVHNTFIDIMLQTGLIGIALYLLFLYLILDQLIKSRKNTLVLLMFFLLMFFSFFHFIYRQPMFWFVLAYIYCLSAAKNNFPSEKESLIH